MSEGIITANLGNAKYSVKLVYDNRGWKSRMDSLLADIGIADAIIADSTIEVNLAYNTWRAAKFRLNNIIAMKELNTKSAVDKVNAAYKEYKWQQRIFNQGIALKHDSTVLRRFLQRTKMNDTMIIDIYCADFTDNLAVGTHVGLLEINNENPSKQGYLIHPNNTHVATIGNSTYNHARDGSMVGAVSIQSTANWAFNHALFPAWQRFQPLYRLAKVTAVLPTGNVNVSLNTAISSHHPEGKNIDINKNPTTTADRLADTNVPVWYMTGSGKLLVNDKVVVMYENQDITKPRIIGFAEAAPPPNWALVEFNYIIFDEVFSDSNSNVTKLSCFDDLREISYVSSDIDLVVRFFDSNGSSTATYTYVTPIPTAPANSDLQIGIFATSTGFVLSTGKRIVVTAVGTTPNTVFTFIESEDGALAYESTKLASFNWVRSGTYTYERVVQDYSTTSVPIDATTKHILANSWFSMETMNDGNIALVPLTAPVLSQRQQWISSFGSAFYYNQELITLAEQQSFYTQASGSITAINKFKFLLAKLNQGVDLLKTTLPAVNNLLLNVWQPWTSPDSTSYIKWIASQVADSIIATTQMRSEHSPLVFGRLPDTPNLDPMKKEVPILNSGIRTNLSRPTMWIHESDSVGFYSRTKGHTAFNAIEWNYTSPTYHTARGAAYVLKPDGRAFRLNVSGMATQSVSDDDIWRVLSRAPLSKPNLANPNP